MTREPRVRLRRYAALAGCAALTALGGLTLDQVAAGRAAAAGPNGPAVITEETPPSTPQVTKAQPSITGPAPLYAGQDPDTNPESINP